MKKSTTATVSAEVREQEGQRLGLLIEELTLGSKADFAQRSGLGTPSYLSQIISGHRPLSIEAATKIAKHLKIPIDDFSPRVAAMVRDAAACVTSQQGAMPIATRAERLRATAWPLKVIDYEGFISLPKDVLTKLEGAILVLRPPTGNGKARSA